MHYDSYGNGHFRNPAIVKLDGSIIEPNKKISEIDIVTLNKMYPCEDSCDKTNVQGKRNCHKQLHGQRIIEDLLFKNHSSNDVLNPFFRQRFAFQNKQSRI